MPASESWRLRQRRASSDLLPVDTFGDVIDRGAAEQGSGDHVDTATEALICGMV